MVIYQKPFLKKFTTKANPYPLLASSITQKYPASAAIMVAKTVLITEKRPLIPMG